MKPRDAERSKNFFALGLISWMYTRPVEPDDRVDRAEVLVAAAGARREPRRVQGRAALRRDRRAVRAPYEIQPAKLAPGKYRNITGNLAVAYGLIAGAQQARLPILYASYPITPASDILHELSKHKNFGVRTLQAEDEIAAAAVAIGAAFAGQLGITATSGPGRRPQVGGARSRDQPRAAAGASSTCSAAARRPDCPPRPSSPT